MLDDEDFHFVMDRDGKICPVDQPWISQHIKTESKLGKKLLTHINQNRNVWTIIPSGRASTRSTAVEDEADDTLSSASDATNNSLLAVSVPVEFVSEAAPDAGLVFFRQEGDNCVAAAAANALHLLDSPEQAEIIFKLGESVAGNFGGKQTKFFSALNLAVRGLKPSESGTIQSEGERTFSKYDAEGDFNRKNLLRYMLSVDYEILDPVIGLLVDENGNAEHAVVFFRGYVYDSNKKRAIKLHSTDSLNKCIPNGKKCTGIAAATRFRLVEKSKKRKK